jgi:hypothetical protein
MARAIWSGVLSFGRVPIPPRLYPATEPHQPSFHEFGKGTADLVRCQRISERTGHEAEYSDVVKGASTGGGSYVLLSQDELDEIAPGQSPSLDIRHVADLGEVDPMYFSRAYFLRPGDDATNEATPCYGRHGAQLRSRRGREQRSFRPRGACSRRCEHSTWSRPQNGSPRCRDDAWNAACSGRPVRRTARS